MYVFLSILIITIIINCLCTTVLTSSSNNRILRNLKDIVNTALEQDTSDDVNNDLLIKQLSQILEQEEGFRLTDRKQRSLYSTDDIFDGSGDRIEDKDLPPVFSNISIITFTLGTTTTAFSRYTPYAYPPCQCEKGEQGEKGDAGICPADCGWKYQTEKKDCLSSQINLERLAKSIRQLIIDTKKIAYQNARAMSCTCPTLSTPLPTTSIIPNQWNLDYNTYVRLKGDKGDRGDPGTSCSPTCMQSTQTNVRVFKTLQEATDASITYPDHTYVHLVNEYGRLESVFIRVHGQLIPLRLENENSLLLQIQASSSSSSPSPLPMLSIPKPACTVTLSCPSLHMFALGPHVRKMCYSKRANSQCSKLSDYDNICGRISERHHLKGFYRAFMSTSTQWLSNIFAGICVNAKIVNMHEQILFNTVEDIFEQKAPQSEILDVKGLRPQFQYWWHGTFVNGTASSDTCLDWSRQDSSLSGIASSLPDGINGLFYHQYTWPCSIRDSNMGILCIETDCNRNPYYKN